MLSTDMEEKEQPLVSVRVITYNSSKTVIETLDSIYNQTYPNIELIISDDCSKDDTVAICREWVNQHKERFARTEILTVPQNTGVSANINRSEKACR
jgi:alpha-1,3-rhamnosyltransferase